MSKNIITGIDNSLRNASVKDIIIPIQYNIVGEKRNKNTSPFSNTNSNISVQFGHSVVDTIKGAIADGRINVGSGTGNPTTINSVDLTQTAPGTIGLTINWTDSTGTSRSTIDPTPVTIPDEVIENTGPLTGAVPINTQFGIDTTSGTLYYNNAGTWAPVPTATVDLNTTVSQQTGNGAGLTSPVGTTAIPDIGDTHIEVYDDVTLYFTATAANWTTPAVVEVSRLQVSNLATDNLIQDSEARTYDMNTEDLSIFNGRILTLDSNNLSLISGDTTTINSGSTLTVTAGGDFSLDTFGNAIKLNSNSGSYFLNTAPALDTTNNVQTVVRNSVNGALELKTIESTSYLQTFVAADWVGGTTLTITQTTHNLTASSNYHITVRDSAGDELIVDNNVSGTGDITLTITSPAFDGRVLISK